MHETLTSATVPSSELDKVAELVTNLPDGSQLADALLHMVTALRDGSNMTLVEQEELLSPQQAADMLGVSRPHFLKLVARGEIAEAASIGTHRQFKALDVVDFMARREAGHAAVAHAYGNGHMVEAVVRAGSVVLTPEQVEELKAL